MSDTPQEDPKPRRRNGANHQDLLPSSEPPPSASPSASIFDNLDELRLDTSLTTTVAYLGHVPVRKPGRVEFVRTHPDPAMSLASTVYVDEDERETYFVAPPARPLLLGYLKSVLLLTCISRQGVTFLWPVPLPDEEGGGGGRGRAWGDTARQAADLARSSWLRIKADMALGGYQIHLAEGALPDPVWPDKTFQQLLAIAFRNRIIDGSDHPIIRKHRGLS